MAFTFQFPDVGEGIHEGRIVEWLVAEGDTVAVDQPLVKVETDKAVVELPSPEAGAVLAIHVPAGETIEVGNPLVTLGAKGEETPDASPPKAARQPVEGAPRPAPTPTKAGSPATRRPLATPRTRALARSLGVDLTAVSGTGSSGRITDDDVRRAAEGPAQPPAAAAPAAAPAAAGELVETAEGLVERIPITHLRQVIARTMRESKQTAAHVTHVDEADVTALYELYTSMKPAILERSGVRFTLLPLFIKALIAALTRHPLLNAEADEEAGVILLKRFFNIGFAVDTPDGLIVPVITNADRKDMVELASEIADKAERARERRLTLDELRGGTCTVTNIGPLGGLFATPIIHQPELAIVGLHTIAERPVVRNGEIVIRRMMYLSVSFDHRWIDGAEGARFMTDLVKLIENPGLLMASL
jgi:pyruvate dehydrogenase E2 component (dihydrolipoamide acetyltransferase)